MSETAPAAEPISAAPEKPEKIAPLVIDAGALERRMTAPDPAPDAKPLTERDILAAILLLLSDSPGHRFLFLSDLEWLVRPPLRLRQYKLHMNEGRPVAYVSWARLAPESETRFKASRRLSPLEWDSGEAVWMVDLVAPYGGTDFVLDDLRRNVFRDGEFNYFAKDQSGWRVETARGYGPSADAVGEGRA